MILYPCHHCRLRAGCATKKEKLAQLRPLKLSKATFPCDIQRADLKPGQIVRVTMVDLTVYPERNSFDLEAVFTHWHGSAERLRAVVAFLPGQDLVPSPEHPDELVHVVGLRHKSIIPTDRFMADACPECGLPAELLEQNDFEWWCTTCNPGLHSGAEVRR